MTSLEKTKKRLRRLGNNYRAYRDYFRRRSVLKNEPRVFAIELTNYCNLDCAMCPRPSMKRKVGFMEFDLFKSVIDQCRAHTDTVWLHLFGESLFHPRLKQCIEYCVERGIRPRLSTNATILDEDKARLLLDSGLDLVYLCLDGSNEETYNRLRVKGDFRTTRENIARFLELKKTSPGKTPAATVSMIRMAETAPEIEAFRDQWTGLADKVLIKKFCAWAGQDESIAEKRDRQARGERRSPGRRHPCLFLWKSVAVHWNGDVVPCCLDYDGKLVLGNLKTQDLKTIWNSPRFRALREAQSAGDFDNPLCRNCGEWIGYSSFVPPPHSAAEKKFV